MQTIPIPQRAGPDRPDLVVLVAIALAYFLAGKLGLSFAAIHSSASAVWPPTGIALAAFLLFGRGAWPAVFAGAFLVNITTSGSIATSVAIAAGNTAEGLVGAWLVARYARGPACFERVADVFKFAALAAGLATTVSATAGVLALTAAGQADIGAFWRIWTTWWLGDAAGALVFAPPIVLWYRDRSIDLPEGRLAEAELTLTLVMAVGVLCFASPVLSGYPLMFLCMPPLAWVAFRFGRRAAASHVVLLALIAIYTTEHGVGPFVMATRHESLLVLQAFMATIALMMLPIAALVAEYGRATAALESANVQERRARAEAEAASGAKDEFLAMLSHELRNPLQAIASSVWLMERTAVPGDARSRPIEILKRQTEHLTRLVNDLLDVARLTAGKIAILPQPVNLADAIRRNVNALEVAGKIVHHAVQVEAENIWLRADPARLDQMLGNLIVNALKYTPQGGAIRVRALHEGDIAVVSVRDEGVGISEELLPRVFDLFTQGDRGIDRREGGLGVGLALVRRLAQLHGGSVEARSEGPGRGAEFVLRLPVLARPVEGAGAAAARAVEPRRVLIVEDNADVRAALRTLLEHDGHEVFEAEDGMAGIDTAMRVKPQIVLIDIGLPRVDGYQVAQTLRSREDALGPGLRLVAVTGYGQPEDKRRARNAGFDEHLVKPVDADALARALAT